MKQEREYLQALLLLFSICHIVIVCLRVRTDEYSLNCVRLLFCQIFMPHPHIDLSYIKMLKLVGHFRYAVCLSVSVSVCLPVCVCLSVMSVCR